MTTWVWAPDPYDTWFGPYDDAGPELARLQAYFPIPLQEVQDSKLVRRRVEFASMPLEEEED